jgi:DNA-binding transcriptional regulator LsrR (DeoR family)
MANVIGRLWMTAESELQVRELTNIEFLARVASMYYEDGLTQQRIAKELGYSRSAISRFLTTAREAGVVEILVHHPLKRVCDLEAGLGDRFNLKTVRVFDRQGLDYNRMLGRLGSLGAQIVESYVQDGMKIGVSWGTGVFEVSNALRPPYLPNVTVIQLVGALGTPDPEIDGVELARSYARTFGGRYRILPAPAIVESPQVRDALLKDRAVREVLEAARAIDLAVVGIGTTKPEKSSLVRAEYLTQQEVLALSSAGAVGDICAIHFDSEGSLLDLPLAARTVAIRAEDLRRIPLVLGVAGGEVKASAIRGALRSGLINALVTDDVAAQLVLEAEKLDSSVNEIRA